MDDSLKADVLDSLYFLMELNREMELLKTKDITEEEFIDYLFKRKTEYGYISDHKKTFKIINVIKNMSDVKK